MRLIPFGELQKIAALPVGQFLAAGKQKAQQAISSLPKAAPATGQFGAGLGKITGGLKKIPVATSVAERAAPSLAKMTF